MTISVMKHGAYIAAVKFDPEIEMFRGEVLNLAKGGFDFYADSVAGLKREFAKSADEYEAFCMERGGRPEKPLSGNFSLRVDTKLHAALTAQAKAYGVSLNKWAATILRKAAEEDGFLEPKPQGPSEEAAPALTRNLDAA